MASYCGPAAVPGGILFDWNVDPWLIGALALAALATARASRPRLALAGVATLAVAFVTPLCALSVALFAARAVHHMLVVAVAAPLIAFSLPPVRRTGVAAALALATATLWAWHLPAAYDAALADAGLYWAMQLSLLASAVAFWRVLAAAPPALALPGAVGGMAQMGLLGGVLTFARVPLYRVHLATTSAWGMDPLADQQLGGLLMWVLGMLPYAAAAAWLGRSAWRRLALA